MVIRKDEAMNQNIRTTAFRLREAIQKEYAYLVGIPDKTASVSEGASSWSIKETLGHLIDSASNNHQRMVRLQYNRRLDFPDYQRENELWVGIQRYATEDWLLLVELWKYFNLHIAHVIESVDPDSLGHTWDNGQGVLVSLEDIIIGYLDHVLLHMKDIRHKAAVTAARTLP